MENRFDARERLNALSTGTKIALPAAILLLIDLFLPWQDFGNAATEAFGVDASFNGWRGFWGILLGLVTLALIVWLGLQIAGVDLSGVNMPVTHAMITLGLGVLLLAVAVIKLLTILGDEATIWAWIGTILAAVAAYGAYQRSREMEEMAPAGSSGFGAPDTTPGPGAGTTTGTGLGDDVTTPPPPPPTAPPTTTAGTGSTGGGYSGGPTTDMPEERPGGPTTTPPERPGGPTTTPPPRDEP